MALHNVHGAAAESAVCKYLQLHGYKIIGQNWRRPSCEIDIVSAKDKTMYFVEVKYRQNDSQGSGFAYITAAKRRQMERAAELWVQENGWEKEYCLAAAEVSGPNFEQINFIEML